MDLLEKTDRDLVVDTLADRNAYVGIVDRYQPKLKRYITRLGCRDDESIKDILQDVFIKVYINLNDYDSSLSFNAWIYRIAHNETISSFRKQKIRPKVFELEDDLFLFENIIDDTDISAELDLKLLQMSVRTALADVNEKYRDVLVLRFLEDKSYDEISDILQIPSGTVATYISRGKQKLKSLLKKTEPTGV
jgi:RNA polymerase sigma-70 factor (ECF subfamily)